jgi:adenosylhomocysteine nucleosidase
MPDAYVPKRVGVLAPMPSELGPVVKAMGLERDTIGSLEVRRGKVGDVEVVATKTGIGTKRARDATNRLLDAAEVDHVLVVGIAGGMGATKVGDVIIPEVVVDKDSNAEYRPTPLGAVTPKGRLVTHDDFDMGEAEHQRLVSEGFVAVDMETAAIASVCAERGCNWSAVRAISDLVGVTPGDVIDLANPDGTPNVGASVRYLITKPCRIPKLVKLARESMQAANAAAKTAANTLRGL